MADDERSGPLKTVITTDNIKKVHQTVLDDRRIMVRKIAEGVILTLNIELDMRKLYIRWVPRSLILDQKRILFQFK